MPIYQPTNKEELRILIQDESIYLGDIDTSLITDMSCLFLGIIRKKLIVLKLGTYLMLKI